MRTARALFLATLILAFTLPARILIRPPPPGSTEGGAKSQAIRSFLESNHLRVEPFQPKRFRPDWTGWHVASNDCDIDVVADQGLDFHQEELGLIAGPQRQVTFIYQGDAFPSPPNASSFIDMTKRRLLWPFGLTRWRQPFVVIVMAKRGCAQIKELPWRQLPT